MKIGEKILIRRDSEKQRDCNQRMSISFRENILVVRAPSNERTSTSEWKQFRPLFSSRLTKCSKLLLDYRHGKFSEFPHTNEDFSEARKALQGQLMLYEKLYCFAKCWTEQSSLTSFQQWTEWHKLSPRSETKFASYKLCKLHRQCAECMVLIL